MTTQCVICNIKEISHYQYIAIGIVVLILIVLIWYAKHIENKYGLEAK